MRKISLFLFIGIILFLGLLPASRFASAATVVTSIWQGASCATGDIPTGECGFCDAIVVAKNIVQILFQFAFPIAVGMIVWGALRMIIAGGDEGRITDAKSIMTDAALGFAIVLGSWLIVNAFLNLLGGGSPLPWATISCT
ncbi:MAG: hypothetical protein WCW78_01240 [Candidatus Paceibacterota bacterium]|jgi:hypothetical protein